MAVENERTVTGMADMMNFPKRWEDFLHDYEFEDSRRVYTNGSRLIPSFRVKQMMEHYALRPVSREQVEKAWTAEWTVDEFGHKCSKCGEYLPDGEDVRKPQFCPECGRAMTDEAVDMVMERLEELHET